MSTAEPPATEPADTPFEPAPRAEDEPAPAATPDGPSGTPAPRGTNGAGGADEYEPL
ncbi:hypothetical protein ABZ883_39165 [Streptomyces sp. NPDC046977]|uniref:hypothetical protein n=1 Tax=Streptomyces sp. NPDC046977 TaxID=3154703 RepID=UPI0033EE80F9